MMSVSRLPRPGNRASQSQLNPASKFHQRQSGPQPVRIGHRSLLPQLRPKNAKGRPMATSAKHPYSQDQTGAGEEIRTLDPNLGKVMLYP